MRASSGKGNSSQKILSYYRVNFGILAPYQVLCDGPTIFQSFKNDIFLKQALPTLFGAPAYPVVTNCIVNELRQLGESFSNSAIFAKRATRVPCAHEGEVSATECVTLRVNTPFETKLVLATNDAQLLLQVAKTPGVPVVTIANQTKLVLRSPSPATIAFVREREVVKSDELHDADKALLMKVLSEQRARRADRRVSIKRKSVKGPNPLSVKKAKKSPPAGIQLTSLGAPETVGKENDNLPTNESNINSDQPPAAIARETESCMRKENESGSVITSSGTTGKRKRRRKKASTSDSQDIHMPTVTSNLQPLAPTDGADGSASVGRRKRKRRRKSASNVPIASTVCSPAQPRLLPTVAQPVTAIRECAEKKASRETVLAKTSTEAQNVVEKATDSGLVSPVVMMESQPVTNAGNLGQKLAEGTASKLTASIAGDPGVVSVAESPEILQASSGNGSNAETIAKGSNDVAGSKAVPKASSKSATISGSDVMAQGQLQLPVGGESRIRPPSAGVEDRAPREAGVEQNDGEKITPEMKKRKQRKNRRRRPKKD